MTAWTTSTATVTLTVTPLDDAPVVGAPATLPSTAEETVTVITEAQLLANATEVDGEALQVANVTVTDATLSDPVIDPETGARSWTVTPDLDFNGDISVSYDVSDGTTAVPASTTLTVTPVDDAPVIAAPASVSATEDEGIVIEGISISDVDYADEQLNVTLSVGFGELSVGEHHGSSVTLTGNLEEINAELSGSGRIYRANDDFVGPDPIADDLTELEASKTVTLEEDIYTQLVGQDTKYYVEMDYEEASGEDVYATARYDEVASTTVVGMTTWTFVEVEGRGLILEW